MFMLAVLSVLVVSLTIAVRADEEATVSSGTSLISLPRLDNFVNLATEYLVRISHTHEQDQRYPGRFTYIAHMGQELQLDGFDEHPQRQYNLLRHNGAVYALALSYDRIPNEDVKDAMVRGIHYLTTEAIEPVPHVDEDLLAPWEKKDPSDDSEDSKMTAKLGGAGLGLIALCNAERIVPGTTDLQDLRKIGNFIRFLQREDGSFTSRYSSTEGKDDSWNSLYYPGEAALGLVYLSELETDQVYKHQWIVTATAALVYLEGLRRTAELEDVEADHWALLATSRLLPNLDDNSVEYWLIYNHGVRVVESMLSSHTEEELVEYDGCFTYDERTCPTATRLEGLIASLSFVRDHEMLIDEHANRVRLLRTRMLHDIELGIEFLLGSQQQSDENNMKGSVPVKYPAEDSHLKEVRVDYVQHSMSAIIAYEYFLTGGAKPSHRLWAGILSGQTIGILAFGLAVITLLLVLLSKRTSKSRRTTTKSQ